MSIYFPGYQADREKVMKMDDDQLLKLIDDLYGRKNLSFGATHDDILAEALEQHKEEWTNKGSEEYERTQFYIGLAKAMKNK